MATAVELIQQQIEVNRAAARSAAARAESADSEAARHRESARLYGQAADELQTLLDNAEKGRQP